MNTSEIRNNYSIDILLEGFSSDDPTTIVLGIDALKSIIDQTQTHHVADSFKDKVKAIQLLVETPPIGLNKVDVIIKIAAKIDDLSKVALRIQEKAKVDEIKVYEAFNKLRENELVHLEQEKGALQLYTALEGRSDFDSKDTFDVFTKVNEFLQDKEKRSLLLQGDAGAGKTTFCYYFALALWKAHEKGINKDKPIPVLIPLITIEGVEKKLINEHLSNRGLDAGEILLLKNHFSFIFILEGYDERNVFKNFYKTNFMDQLKCKVITSCRTQALLQRQTNYRFDFASTKGDLEEIILCPFKEEKIQQYISNYTKLHKDQLEWKAELYWQALSQLPSILDLASNPFVLSMTQLALPKLFKENNITFNEEKKEKYEKLRLTQEKLYDAFIDDWFERQLKKLDTQGILTLKDNTRLTKKDFLTFNQKISSEMIRHKTKFLEVPENLKTKGENWQSQFFTLGDEMTTVLSSGWLLKKVGPRTYTFLHDSLRTHFASKQLCHGILSRSSFSIGHPLNEQLIVDQYDLLETLVERVNNDPAIEKILFELIETSKHEPQAAIGAANAITILSKAGVPFFGRDLSRVRIQGADLSGAILSLVNFAEADLRDVNFCETCINGVNFTGACMDGVQFGQLPLLQFKDEITKCCYSPNGKLLAVVSGGTIYIHDVHEGNELYKLEYKKLFERSPRTMCFSPESDYLTIGGNVGLHFWYMEKNELVLKLKGDVSYLTFCLDRRYIAVGENNGIVRLFDYISMKLIHSYCIKQLNSDLERSIQEWDFVSDRAWDYDYVRRVRGYIENISFSPDGRFIGSSTLNKSVLWDLDSGKELKCWEDNNPFYDEYPNLKQSITYLTMSINYKILVQVDQKIIMLGGMADDKETPLNGREISVLKLFTFSPDGNSLASVNSKKVILVDVTLGKVIQTFEGHSGNITTVGFSPDGNTLVSGSLDNTIRLWNVNSKKSRNFKEYNELRLLHVSHDGNEMITQFDEFSISFWNIAYGKKGRKIRLFEDAKGLFFVKFSNNAKMMLLESNNVLKLEDIDSRNILLEIDYKDLKHHFEFENYLHHKNCSTFSPDDANIAFGIKNKIFLYDVVSQKRLNIFTISEKEHDIINIVFSPDGSIISALTLDGVHIWNKPYYIKRNKIDGDGRYDVIDFSSKGNIMALGGTQFLTKNHSSLFIELLDVGTRQLLKTFTFGDSNKTRNNISALSFSPNDSTIAFGCTDFTLRLLDVESGKHIHIIKGFIGEITKVIWKRDGSELITRDASGAIRRYILPRDLKKYPPMLFWSTHGSQGLWCEKTIITQVTGLSPQNRRLLEQNHAVGQVSQTTSDKIIAARDELEVVGKGCETIFGRMKNGDFFGLRDTKWVVSIAHKKENEHAFVILEGIENEKRVIYQAEVFLDTEKKTHVSKIPIQGELGFGYAYVQFKPITSHSAQELAKKCHFRSEPIKKELVDEIKKLILKDAEGGKLYNNLGSHPIYAISFGGVEYGNCLSYAEKWLKGAKVQFVEETGWKESLIPFDISSQRNYLNTESHCLVQ